MKNLRHLYAAVLAFMVLGCTQKPQQSEQNEEFNLNDRHLHVLKQTAQSAEYMGMDYSVDSSLIDAKTHDQNDHAVLPYIHSAFLAYLHGNEEDNAKKLLSKADSIGYNTSNSHEAFLSQYLRMVEESDPEVLYSKLHDFEQKLENESPENAYLKAIIQFDLYSLSIMRGQHNQAKVHSRKRREIGFDQNDSTLITESFIQEVNTLLYEQAQADILRKFDSAQLFAPKNDLEVRQRLAIHKMEVYKTLNMIPQAVTVATTVHEMSKHSSSLVHKTYGLQAMAWAFSEREMFDSALVYQKKAYRTYQIQFPFEAAINHLGYTSFGLSRIYHSLKILDSALLYSDSSFYYHSQNSIFTGPPSSAYYFNHASILADLGHIDSAEHYMNLGKTTQTGSSSIDKNESAQMLMAKIHKDRGRFDEAMEHMEKTLELKEQKYKERNQAVLADVLSSDEIAKRDNNILKLKVSELALESKLYKSRLRILIYVLIGSILTLLLIMRHRVQRRKSDQIIRDKEIEINRQSEVIDRFEQELAMAELHALTRERQKIASDIHDDILSELAGVVQLSDKLNASEPNSPEVSNLCVGARKTYEKARIMLHELANQNEHHEEDLFSLQLLEYINKFIRPLGFSIEEKLGDIHKFNNLDVESQIHLLRCTKEIITNVVKHAHANKITISTGTDGSNGLFTIHDNGKGFDTNASTTGLGIKGIKKRISKVGGSVEVSSSKGRGTKYSISIPISEA